MNILLVDDNEDYLMLVREALYMSGYNVHTAHDGIEGCEVLPSTKSISSSLISGCRGSTG